MARTRATALSAVVLALALTGAGATPFIVQSASASVTALDPVEPCDVGEVCDITPETTVTVTTTLGEPTPEETDSAPETTVTKTVTATPTKKTKAPTPTKTSPTTTPPPTPPTQNPQPLPTQPAEVPSTTEPTTTPEETVSMPAIAPEETTPVVPTPSETQVASDEEVPLELRNAAPEFDQRTLTQKLSIPALVLVLLALFAVLIFEGRLRRMAHAAAVRKAGPPIGGPEMPPPGAGYPAGPGYATAGFQAPGYPGGTAYAPIISFVPVQTYPSVPPGYQDSNHPYPPQGYVQEPYQEPVQEPVVLHPDEFDSYSEPPSRERDLFEPATEVRDPFEPASGPRERDPFEPLVPPVPSDIPPGGAGPYDGDQEQPLGPASAAESGDPDPWKPSAAGSLFEPAAKETGPGAGDSTTATDYEPPPYLAPDADVTAVQPLPPQFQEQPPQEPTKEMPDAKRRRFGRKKK
ncbi:hypothetical protein AB0C27_38465 [Nonomuraea sp. NPDC048882]|uniref:hypothetical protein n=1 Tax=Nonomuraea sp. NPDC048882 TaxID=3154347 RepID=UPI0033F8E6C9